MSRKSGRLKALDDVKLLIFSQNNTENLTNWNEKDDKIDIFKDKIVPFPEVTTEYGEQIKFKISLKSEKYPKFSL